MKLSKITFNFIDKSLNNIIIFLVVISIISFIYSFSFKNNSINSNNSIDFEDSTVQAINNINNIMTNKVINNKNHNINNIMTNKVINNGNHNINNNGNHNINNNIPINSIGSKNNQVENFLAYVDKQKFCPNIYNSSSSFWCKFPEIYGKGLLGKFCCTSCYYIVCKEIYCGDNNEGMYKLCKLSHNDITNLKKYYSNSSNKKHKPNFEFPEQKLLQSLGSNVLKMKYNNIMYPIQIIKSLDELNKHEKNPTIASSLYKETYKC